MTALLRDTDGYLVECPEGEVGRVEELWLDEAGEPRALAVLTRDGRHGLLLERDVVAVQREQGWVVVPSRPALHELAPPRLSGDGGVPAASWRTTGEILATEPRPAGKLRRWRDEQPAVAPEPPLWRAVALLYGSLAFIVALVIAAAFIAAQLVGGAAY